HWLQQVAGDHRALVYDLKRVPRGFRRKEMLETVPVQPAPRFRVQEEVLELWVIIYKLIATVGDRNCETKRSAEVFANCIARVLSRFAAGIAPLQIEICDAQLRSSTTLYVDARSSEFGVPRRRSFHATPGLRATL